MPKPKAGETQEAFTSRFMEDANAQTDYPTTEQRAAVANQYWEAYNMVQKALQESPYADPQLAKEALLSKIIYQDAKNFVVSLFEVGDNEDEQVGEPVGDVELSVTKSRDTQQLVFGWANWARDAQGNIPFDWDGDIKSIEELEAAAYKFVLKARESGIEHDREEGRAGMIIGNLIESMVFTKEKMQVLGIPEGILPEAWWVGFHVPDPAIFEEIRSGKYKMFSIHSTAIRRKVI